MYWSCSIFSIAGVLWFQFFIFFLPILVLDGDPLILLFWVILEVDLPLKSLILLKDSAQAQSEVRFQLAFNLIWNISCLDDFLIYRVFDQNNIFFLIELGGTKNRHIFNTPPLKWGTWKHTKSRYTKTSIIKKSQLLIHPNH